LLEDINVILKIFDITGHIRKSKRSYALYVLNQQSQKLGKMLNIKDKKKQFEINELLKRTFKYEYSKNYDKVPNIVKDRIIFEKRKDRYKDIMFDKIVSIEEVNNTTNYAYDLTVQDTKNFDIYNSLCLRDTFHAAGVGSGSLVITEGIPRLREIIHISKNLKNRNMSIYLKEEYSNKDSAKKLQSKFCYTQLKDILQKSEILYSNNVTEKNEDYEFIKSYKEFTDLFNIDNINDECMSPWILRLIFDKESLMNKKISVQEIHETIKENFYNEHDIECIFSDDSVNDVVMRIRLKIDKNGNFLEFMKDFEKQLIELPLRGIININQVELSESNIIKYDNNGSFYATKEWILKTSGSNLLDILADDSVDINRTITNDIIEFYEIFGIEATRELIYRELSNVYSSKNPNPRHIQMLSDIMTYRGKLMQIDRHGLNKNSEIGPIAKASFEEVMNIFTKSAIFAEVDNMKGVSANIFAGQFCKAGTNCFDILIDEDKLLEKIDIPNYIEEEIVDDSNIEETFEKVYSKYDKNDDVKDEDFNFGFGIEQNKEHLLDKIIISDITISNKDSNADFYNNIGIENVKYVKYESNESNSNNESNSSNSSNVSNESNASNSNSTNTNPNDDININFEKININEPKYEEKPEDVDISTKTKKIKVKKVKKNN
jgi:DNA-directed RNA polymerase beta' subunit